MSGKFSSGSCSRIVLKEKCLCSRWTQGEGLSKLGTRGGGREIMAVLVVLEKRGIQAPGGCRGLGDPTSKGLVCHSKGAGLDPEGCIEAVGRLASGDGSGG